MRAKRNLYYFSCIKWCLDQGVKLYLQDLRISSEKALQMNIENPEMKMIRIFQENLSGNFLRMIISAKKNEANVWTPKMERNSDFMFVTIWGCWHGMEEEVAMNTVTLSMKNPVIYEQEKLILSQVMALTLI